MKSNKLLAMALIAGTWLGFSASASRGAEPSTRPGAAVADREVPGALRPLELIRRALDDLHLSDAEKEKIHAIVEPYRKELEAWRDANKTQIETDRAAIKAAIEAKDRPAAKNAIEALKTLLETAPKPKTVIEQIVNALRPEQGERFKALLEKFRAEIQEHREQAATKP